MRNLKFEGMVNVISSGPNFDVLCMYVHVCIMGVYWIDDAWYCSLIDFIIYFFAYGHEDVCELEEDGCVKHVLNELQEDIDDGDVVARWWEIHLILFLLYFMFMYWCVM